MFLPSPGLLATGGRKSATRNRPARGDCAADYQSRSGIVQNRNDPSRIA